MRLQILGAVAVTLLTSFPTATAIFEDEAYVLDYAHNLVGLPSPSTTFFHKPQKNSKASLLYTLSDVGVLGAVNPGTGDIVWRQILDADLRNGGKGNWTDGRGSIRANGENIVTVVNDEVRSWDAMLGRERWGNEFPGSGKDIEVLEGVGAATDGDVLVLFETPKGEAVTRRLNGKTGDVVWEHTEAGDVPLQVSTDVQSVFAISLQGKWGGYNIKISTLDPVTGKKTDEHVLTSKSDIQSVDDVLFVGANSAAPIIAWLEKGFKSVKVNVLGTKAIHSLPLAASSEGIEKVMIHAPRSIQSQPHFLVHSQSKTAHWAEVYHVDIKSGTVTEAYHLPKLSGSGAFSTSEIDANVYFTRNTREEVIIVSSASHAILGRWALQTDAALGGMVHGVSEVVKTKDGTYAVRAAVTTTDDDWVMVRNGGLSWTRPEGLSGAVSAAWAEIPQAEALAQTLAEEAHSNPVSAYIHRVNRHINDLQYLPGYLSTLPQKIISAVLPGEKVASTDLVKDFFGFHKLIILATQRGRVYALDSTTGKIVWSVRAFDMPIGEKWIVRAIYVDNQKGTVTIRGSEGEYVILKSTTGVSVETMWRGSWPTVQSTAIVDSPSGQWLLPIGVGGDPGPIPNAWAPQGILVVRGKAGEVKGLTFKTKGEQAVPVDVWSFQPAKGEIILSVKSRPAHDPVASIGRALADRTVLYKYINPNVVLITAVSESTSTATIYLLDSSSGSVLYSTTHTGVDVTKPIASEIVENTFAYTIFSDISKDSALPLSKGYQLIVAELYESALTNDRGPLGPDTNYSSLLPSEQPSDDAHLPHVKTAAFLIPAAVSLMTTTSTLQGITTKSLLLYSPTTNSIISLPAHVLDPRRPAGRAPTKLEQEDGIMPYSPNIEFDPKVAITHKREIIGVRDIITEPALIESTSLVFAYGIDIFGTRVSPSGAFDVLGKGFNKLSLVATVVGLGVGVGILGPMVRRKQIDGRWRTA